MEIFKQGWRYLRDNFYDEKYHGADWNAVYTTYEPLVQSARTTDEVRRLMNLMVGELNRVASRSRRRFDVSAVANRQTRTAFRPQRIRNERAFENHRNITLSPADVAKKHQRR